jgi:hypothetical protein
LFVVKSAIVLGQTLIPCLQGSSLLVLLGFLLIKRSLPVVKAYCAGVEFYLALIKPTLMLLDLGSFVIECGLALIELGFTPV